MKTITLQEAHTILANASAVIVNYDALVYLALEDLQDDLDNRFLYLSWEYEGRGFDLTFAEDGNQEVRVEGSDMFLYDIKSSSKEDATRLTILTTKQLE